MQGWGGGCDLTHCSSFITAFKNAQILTCLFYNPIIFCFLFLLQFKVPAMNFEAQMIRLANVDRPYILRTYVYATRT